MQNIRDQPDTLLRYFNAKIPRNETVTALGIEYTDILTLGETSSGAKKDYKKRRARVVSQHAVTVHDTGDKSWDFEVNGFKLVPAAAPIRDFTTRSNVRDEYAPRVFEIVKESIVAESPAICQTHWRSKGSRTASRHSFTSVRVHVPKMWIRHILFTFSSGFDRNLEEPSKMWILLAEIE